MFTGSAAKQDLTRQHPRRLGARLRLVICGYCLSVLANGVARAQASVDYRDYFERGVQLQAADIPALEAALAADTNNPEIRLKLLGYYSSQNSSMTGPIRQKVIAQTEWLIEHDPASPILRRLHFITSDFPPGDKEYPRIVALWNKQVADHPDNVAIVHNALLSLVAMPISVSYGMKVRVLDPYEVDGILRTALALTQMIKSVQDAPSVAPANDGLTKLTALTVQYFAQSRDAALIGTTGRALVDTGGRQGSGLTLASAKQGVIFLERAHTLDPNNPKWANASASTFAPTPSNNELNHLYRWLDEEDLWPDRKVPSLPHAANFNEVAWKDAWSHQYSHRFGQDMESSVRAKSPGDQFPTVFSDAEGRVTFELLVNEKGSIVRYTPLSGSAGQVAMIEDDVTTWRFHPWLVEGKPMAFHTTGTILIHVSPFPGGASLSGAIGGVLGGAAQSPNRGGAMRVPGSLIAGQRLTTVNPEYPAVARAAHVTGTVVMHAIISKAGSIENLTVISGPPLLQGAALDAVKQWRYKPFLLKGEPTEVDTTITVNFSTLVAPPK